MKFYDLDLTQIIPYGIPLNTKDNVEYTGFINEFFLRGFERWFRTLFTTEGGELTQDYGRSCTAPFSLAACNFCTNSQLQTFIEEQGFRFYSANAHNINAQFLFDLYKHPFGTEKYLTTIARYCANTLDVAASASYIEDQPFTYIVNIIGDISGSVNVAELSERMIEHLKILGTAHTQVDGFRFEESDNEAEAFCGCATDDIQLNLNLIVSEPVSDTVLRSYLTNSSNYRSPALNSSSLKGCPRTQSSYLTSNYTNTEDEIVRFHMSTLNTIPYPVLGYADFRRNSINSRYIVNDQDLLTQILSSDKLLRQIYLSKCRLEEYGLSDFKKETLYNNLGIRQQVFSFRQAGFKKYVDAENWVAHPSTFTFMEEGSLSNYGALGYFKDQHFIGYLSNDGKAISAFGGGETEYVVGYRIGSADSTSKFLMDDAYDYVIDKIFGCDDLTHVPTLGSVTDVEIYDHVSDVHGDPIDYAHSFTFGHNSNYRLTLKCSQTIENAIWVQFHLVRKENYLEAWTTTNSNGGSCNSTGTSTLKFLKCNSSPLQPGGVVEGDEESDWGTGFTPVCSYSGTNPTPNSRCFRHLTEAMAFASFANLTTFFSRQTNNGNLHTDVRNRVRNVWGPTTNGGSLFVVARFDSINHADLDVDWLNPRKNRLHSLEITPALAFGISAGYDGCKKYIIDEVNHNSSLSNYLKTELEYNYFTQKYDLIFKYISDESIENITHIKVHAEFYEE